MNFMNAVETRLNFSRVGGDGRVYNLPVDMIHPNPFQPRRHFEPMALVDLATSIKQYGLMQPISVRICEEGGYELVAGERRLRASKLADIPTIPALIVDISDTQSAILAMVENLQRQNLNYIEEAEGYSQLLSQHQLTQEELASKMGKNQSTIANKLRLLRLPVRAKRLLISRDLSERHARALLKIQKEAPEEKVEEIMLEIIEKAAAEGLTVLKTEELIDRMLRGGRVKKKYSHNIKAYIKDIRIFTNTIKQAVGIMRNSGVEAVYDVEEHNDGCTITVMVSY
ncbi:MAG: ParB/RepB/Spo0J family partition protein [Clostridiales bacterium]|jgi:ParB family chromosome partitioning protein|nr:ParB/RepB/Spo0J family partition protein [Clostridiales bacterium]